MFPMWDASPEVPAVRGAVSQESVHELSALDTRRDAGARGETSTETLVHRCTRPA